MPRGKRGKNAGFPAWFKAMERELECPVCLNSFLDPPIFVCENQHGLCSTCRHELDSQGKKCPVCNGKLTGKRNLIVEKILDKLPQNKCSFAECSFKRADLEAVFRHQDEDCDHRKATCGYCLENVAMSRLNQHLITEHKGTINTCTTPSGHYQRFWDISTSTGQQIIRPKSPGNDFYLNSWCLDDHKKWKMMWISYRGPKKNNRKYQYTITVLDKNDNQRHLQSCTKFCVPCDVSRTTVEEDCQGVMISKALAKEAEYDKVSDTGHNYKVIKVSIEIFSV